MSDDDECKRIIITSGSIDTTGNGDTNKNNVLLSINNKNKISTKATTITATATIMEPTIKKDLNNNIDHNQIQNSHEKELVTKSLKWSSDSASTFSTAKTITNTNTVTSSSLSCSNVGGHVKKVNQISKSANAATIPAIKPSHEYEASYLEGFGLDLNARERVFFCANEPIFVQITSYDEEPSMVVLHTNVYTIHVRHGQHAWSVKRKYKQFLKLYEAYALFKTKLNIKSVALSTYLTQQSNDASSAGTAISSSSAPPASMMHNSYVSSSNDSSRLLFFYSCWWL